MWKWLRKPGFRSSEERTREVEALANRGSEAVAELIRVVERGEASCRLAAVRALEQIGSGAAVGCLCDCLRDPSAEVRQAAVHALGEIGTGEAAPFLCQAVLHGQSGAPEALWKLLFRNYPAGSRAAAAYLRRAERGGECLMPGEKHRPTRPHPSFGELRRLLDLFPDETTDHPIPAAAPTTDLPRPAFPAPPSLERLPRPAAGT